MQSEAKLRLVTKPDGKGYELQPISVESSV